MEKSPWEIVYKLNIRGVLIGDCDRKSRQGMRNHTKCKRKDAQKQQKQQCAKDKDDTHEW